MNAPTDPAARYHFDRHGSDYRENFLDITHEMQQRCPIAWTDTYDGHWVAAGGPQVFELARCPHVSNDHDVNNERRGYKGISIPTMLEAEGFRGGMLEMDDPEHRFYRTALNPYLSPAAVKRWIPFVDEIVRACIDDRIETGHIDFVDDLANVVPAVLTLAMLGVRLEKWTIYNEPAHASVYTPPDSPDAARVRELYMAMGIDLFTNLAEVRENPRPGIIDALAKLRIDGKAPPDIELIGMLNLLIGGGFDTTTALTAHALEWLSHNPDKRTQLSTERAVLLDRATEEFLRYFTPAPGDARTVSEDIDLDGTLLREGERLWLSWAMANRDPALFDDPDSLIMDRKNNRHFSFGLGVHRCIGSNVARTVFKSMLTAVLDRMPDYRCLAEGTVHYDSIGVIQGMRHLPASFTPGPRLGPGVEETVAKLQRVCDEQGLARPITELKTAADING
ncbi:cytochrome P450 [Mycolicibacterium conceptionense]|jgi:cytochrome P450|uniref:Cytochrome P450 n=2 Tax=Mycolicibacterium TaxID=1866885 RepID=A0ABR5FT96_9MYCO|nr:MULTISPECIES: cytochrome P450 [Mycolicibacterium]KLI06125.1 cytochrome P450 [Mycolicibacterium senegalense]KLO51165.1 cytochrome P450 [Mycolicibacterium senegalense]KMV15323.1 cytochrome P450 [Mycolicibacterium conceptionense]OBK07767.1 cytochrome [Mycolicibacterium conceptionense]OMB91941.1 cytochrome [Mycolicibacterium conceptionense]